MKNKIRISKLDEQYDGMPLSTKIFNILREDILNGRYREGSKLIESKLAKELQVSRTRQRGFKTA